MAVVIQATCNECGDRFTACGLDSSPPPPTGTCVACRDVKRIRKEFGDNEAGDRLIAHVLGPNTLEVIKGHEAKMKKRRDDLVRKLDEVLGDEGLTDEALVRFGRVYENPEVITDPKFRFKTKVTS